MLLGVSWLPTMHIRRQMLLRMLLDSLQIATGILQLRERRNPLRFRELRNPLRIKGLHRGAPTRRKQGL